jgi:hypothetical protein
MKILLENIYLINLFVCFFLYILMPMFFGLVMICLITIYINEKILQDIIDK